MLNLNIWNVAFTVINLLVLYLFMKHFLIGPVRSILDERKQMIEHDLDEAKNRETEARQMKEQLQASIGNADEEASRIIEEARNRAAAEYEKVLAQARADAAKKMEEADRTIAPVSYTHLDVYKRQVQGWPGYGTGHIPHHAPYLWQRVLRPL